MNIKTKYSDVRTVTVLAEEPGQIVLSENEMQDLFLGLLAGEDEQEVFAVAVFNARMELLGAKQLFRGGAGSTVADPSIIFRYALSHPSVQVIAVGHNHPSGNLTPSDADNRLTKMLKDGAALLGLNLVDHIIVGNGEAYSYAKGGRL